MIHIIASHDSRTWVCGSPKFNLDQWVRLASVDLHHTVTCQKCLERAPMATLAQMDLTGSTEAPGKCGCPGQPWAPGAKQCICSDCGQVIL